MKDMLKFTVTRGSTKNLNSMFKGQLSETEDG